jgi:DNA-binding Lrp family transcriptional regulator
MRPLDDIDRRILQALVEDGRAPWTSLARVVDVPDSTVYRRTAALFDEGRVRVGLLPIVPVESARLYELRLRCRPGRQRDVARKLAERRDMRWVAVVTGDYGVAAELVVPAGAEAAAVIFDDIEQRDDNILASQSSLLMHTFKLPHNLEQGFVYDPRLEIGELAADDRALLTVLAEDGRKSYAAAATEVGANESTIRRRLRTLLRAGGAGTVTVVHPPSLGFEHEGIIRLDVLPEHLESVAEQLTQHPGVHYLAATFGETALVCEIQMRTPAETYTFINDVIGKARGITRMTIEAELIVMKRAFLPTPWTQRAPLELAESAGAAG